jgi:DNA-binding CsgD family transcriptional regulator
LVCNYFIIVKLIQPITPAEFTTTLVTAPTSIEVDYAKYFEPYISQALSFAIGPYCWFIPDTTRMIIVAASENMRQLTPYTTEEWIGKDANFLASNIHPDDCMYILSAITIAAEINERVYKEQRNDMRINIYGRMLDAQKKYRWTLIQFPAHYFNAIGKIESTWFMMTDINHLQLSSGTFTPMMTVIDNSNKANQYFKVMVDTKKMVSHNLPHITKREQKILQLMAKGMNTPAIVEALNISYSTVENHKRNLRRKTNTKTSAELMSFVFSNNLF